MPGRMSGCMPGARPGAPSAGCGVRASGRCPSVVDPGVEGRRHPDDRRATVASARADGPNRTPAGHRRLPPGRTGRRARAAMPVNSASSRQPSSRRRPRRPRGDPRLTTARRSRRSRAWTADDASAAHDEERHVARSPARTRTGVDRLRASRGRRSSARTTPPACRPAPIGPPLPRRISADRRSSPRAATRTGSPPGRVWRWGSRAESRPDRRVDDASDAQPTRGGQPEPGGQVATRRVASTTTTGRAPGHAAAQEARQCRDPRGALEREEGDQRHGTAPVCVAGVADAVARGRRTRLTWPAADAVATSRRDRRRDLDRHQEGGATARGGTGCGHGEHRRLRDEDPGVDPDRPDCR